MGNCGMENNKIHLEDNLYLIPRCQNVDVILQ